MNQKPIQLISDLAIAENDSSRKDSLDFSIYASVISGAVQGTRGPFTVGVFGEWGMGKTSLMRLVKQNLQAASSEEDIIIPIWFNAWMFERVDYPIIPLLKVVVKSLKNQRTSNERMSEGVTNLIDVLESLIKVFKFRATTGAVDIEISPSDGIDAFRALRKKRQTPQNSDYYEDLFEAFDKISAKIVPSNITIVILIDDLDRCFPENAIRLLENIKLILSQPGFFFVLGASRSVIEGYLQSKYKDSIGINGFDGKAYLDKLIQLTFDIPPHVQRIKQFTAGLINDLDNSSIKKELRPLGATIGSVCQYNPRTIVRFLNRLITDNAIYELKSGKSLTTQLPIGIFAVTRSLQQNWKDTYGLLISGENKEDREYCNVVSRWGDNDISRWALFDPDNIDEGFTLNSNAIRRDELRKLKLADPEGLKQIATYLVEDKVLKTLLMSDIGKQWLAKHSLREASISFLVTQPDDTLNSDKFLQTVTAFNPLDYSEDELYTDALKVVIESNKASSSLLQRRMRIGYSRAARLIETMEKYGVIGPSDGARPRDVLVKNVDEARSKELEYNNRPVKFPSIT